MERGGEMKKTSAIEEEDGGARGLGLEGLVAVEGGAADLGLVRIDETARQGAAVVGHAEVGDGSIVFRPLAVRRHHADAALLHHESRFHR